MDRRIPIAEVSNQGNNGNFDGIFLENDGIQVNVVHEVDGRIRKPLGTTVYDSHFVFWSHFEPDGFDAGCLEERCAVNL